MKKNRVRIIGGEWRSRLLSFPPQEDLRPTPDRVRETLFNWLGQDLAGWRVLDAFAGSGALGFEAASRGAAEVLMLERDAVLLRGLAEVKTRLHADAVQVIGSDALAWLSRCTPGRFDLVLLDPPFDSDLFDAALAAAAPAVAAGGFLYLEAPRLFAAVPAGFTAHRHLRAGAVHAHLFRRVDG
jgi:16S rRNA (guanine966-N2)-methyltransferase